MACSVNVWAFRPTKWGRINRWLENKMAAHLAALHWAGSSIFFVWPDQPVDCLQTTSQPVKYSPRHRGGGGGGMKVSANDTWHNVRISSMFQWFKPRFMSRKWHHNITDWLWQACQHNIKINSQRYSTAILIMGSVSKQLSPICIIPKKHQLIFYKFWRRQNFII